MTNTQPLGAGPRARRLCPLAPFRVTSAVIISG
jgi:hypothetical protein